MEIPMWVGRLLRERLRVRVWDDQHANVLAEGVVVAYTDQPTIAVRDDAGNVASWPVDLPTDVAEMVWQTRRLWEARQPAVTEMGEPEDG